MLARIIKKYGFCTSSGNTQFYIHLKDHNEKINPIGSRRNLSYMNPKVVPSNAPQRQKFDYKLKKKHQVGLQKKMFEEYKKKLLTGKIDTEQQVIPDPLWVNGKPTHYYTDYPIHQIISVSHPQSLDSLPYLKQLVSNLQQIKQEIQPSDTIINQSVKFKMQKQTDREGWYKLQSSLMQKMYMLSIDDLLKLKYASMGETNRLSSPKFNQILNDILFQDIPKMSCEQLQLTFYLNRKESFTTTKSQFQQAILTQMQSFYPKMGLKSKILWLLVFTVSRRVLISKPTHKKSIGEDHFSAARFLYKLDLSNLTSLNITQQTASMLIFSLAKLRIPNTHFLTSQLVQFYTKPSNLAKLTAFNTYIAIYYSAYVNDNQGITKSSYNLALFNKAQQYWKTYKPIRQIRILHSIWLNGCFTESAQKLYKNVPISSDSTILHYFAQIQQTKSTSREWKIITQIGNLQSIPLSYFQGFCRFFNNLSNTTNWDLQPIRAKLMNTEMNYDVNRIRNQLLRTSDTFRQIINFIQFGLGTQPQNAFRQFKLPFFVGVPIQNMQFVMFAFPKYKISIDVVNSRQLNNNNILKPSYFLKIQNLKCLGWKHIVVYEKQFQLLTAQQKIRKIHSLHLQFIKEQAKERRQEEKKRSKEIENLREMADVGMLYGNELQEEINTPQLSKAKSLQQTAQQLIQQIQKNKEKKQKKK